MTPDQSTAGAFATSWNNPPQGSVHSGGRFHCRVYAHEGNAAVMRWIVDPIRAAA